MIDKETQNPIVFLTKCRRCGEEKVSSEMVQLRSRPTKICKLCSRIVYRERHETGYVAPKRPEKKTYYRPKKPTDLTYSDRLKDSQGFIRDLNYKPSKYELVTLKTKCGRDLSGWWTGQEWYGRMLRPFHEVIGWKRRMSIRTS